uniref:uncharacterized protein LOC114588183 isoform X2 n=1 Tax=Podarcis muralis TaxID=64176 RepID=UPI0010A019AD|nr:uncharacterized protein LOC114588183 isoform X2 [Podarcis muralis]
MDVAPSQDKKLKQRGNFEKENAWLQEWIHEELAHGEVWQNQYEALLGHQAQLCSLLQAKSFEPLEKKTRALQEELEEAQDALREFQNRSRQRQLRIHKQQKENQRMAETVKELEKKRHLSEWEAKWQAKNDRIRQRQHQIEKLSTTIQGLSLKSQELHRNIALLQDSVMEAQQEMALFQKELLSEQVGTSNGGFLLEERACDQMKRLPCLELNRISFKEQLPSWSFSCICPQRPTLRDACSLLWALAKALLLILLLAVGFHFLQGWFSSQPCLQIYSAPLLYIQPKRLLPPLTS